MIPFVKVILKYYELIVKVYGSIHIIDSIFKYRDEFVNINYLSDIVVTLKKEFEEKKFYLFDFLDLTSPVLQNNQSNIYNTRQRLGQICGLSLGNLLYSLGSSSIYCGKGDKLRASTDTCCILCRRVISLGRLKNKVEISVDNNNNRKSIKFLF